MKATGKFNAAGLRVQAMDCKKMERPLLLSPETVLRMLTYIDDLEEQVYTAAKLDDEPSCID